jgi:DNA mismatch repair protein MutL
MSPTSGISPVRILPETIANKIAAGEVVERPASVVKELVENALDARATRIQVRLVAAGRRTIEVVDNGHGMSEQDALLAIERHATSKIRTDADLDRIVTLGFRGEALASIGAVSRMELVTRRESDEAATRLRVEGGVLRETAKVAAPVGTRVTVNRLYFNTPVRAKFLKGITTELSQSIDTVQRHALAETEVGFQFFHNEKNLIDIPENASLRERVALIWGLGFVKDLVDVDTERAGFRVHGLIGTPDLTRSQRTHEFFFINRRPVVNRALQYGFEEGYRELLTVGRRPVGILMLEAHPRLVDVNIHPTKREVRFRDERVIRQAMRDIVRERLAVLREPRTVVLDEPPSVAPVAPLPEAGTEMRPEPPQTAEVLSRETVPLAPRRGEMEPEPPGTILTNYEEPVQTDFEERDREAQAPRSVELSAMYRPLQEIMDAPLQVFDTYLIVPADERLLIIDQHALHERLTYDGLLTDLEDSNYEAQQLAVPLLVDVPPSHVKLLESNLDLFSKLGIDIEGFGGNTFQVTAVCHLYDDSKVVDAVYHVLDSLAQGDLFNREAFMADLLRLTVEACRGSVKAGDRLSPQERRGLLDGFRRLRPPYTCPHGRPIITELTQTHLEKSFRRTQ